MKSIKNKIIISLSAMILFAGGLVSFANKPALEAAAPAVQKNVQGVELNIAAANEAAKKAPVSENINENDYIKAEPLDIVANPDKYLGKKVKFRAVFDKFSTLGLDYKPAFRDSQKYISFLIKRDDVTDHTIPLSEMKIFIKRTYAEKFIELDSGDVIEVYGKVFSNALTDAWVDTDKLVVITKKNKDKEKKA